MTNQNDEEAARNMQQDETRRAQPYVPQAQPVSAFSGTGYTLSGQTVPATQAPAYAVPTAGQATGPFGFQGQAFVGQQQQPYVPANADEQRLMSTYSLGRAVRILAIMDSVILLINVFVFGPFVVLFAWGPICGYLSSKRYSPPLALTYLVYYGLRIGFDVAMAAMGVWWFIISLVLDIFLARYILLYWQMLRKCTPEELQALRTPQQMWERSSNYFRYF